MSIAEKMAHFAFTLSYGELPKEVLEKAKSCLINAIGIGISAYKNENFKIAKQVIEKEEKGVFKTGGSTIFCDGRKATSMGAAFVNAVLFLGQYQEDTLGTCHIGPIIPPLVLALAEKNNSSGRRVIEAIVLGYEIIGLLEKNFSSFVKPRGFRATTIFGIFGCAAAASKIMGLSEAETSNALGFATAFASGILEYQNSGTSEWFFEVGLTSKEGILAALLAQSGAIASRRGIEGNKGFLKAFTGNNKNSEHIADDLGKNWSILKTAFKLYPVSDINQAPVRAVLSLVRENNLKCEDILRVTIKVNPNEHDRTNTQNRGPFYCIEDTMQSIPFCVATAIVEGKIIPETLRKFDSEKINELIKKVVLIPEKNVQNFCSIVIIETMEGAVYKKNCNEGTDYYFLNLERTVALAKEVMFISGIHTEKAKEIVSLLMNLENITNIKPLAEILGSCP